MILNVRFKKESSDELKGEALVDKSASSQISAKVVIISRVELSILEWQGSGLAQRFIPCFFLQI
jgi:hypothetical protein